ncbi:MAG: DUF5012 domain-containing protein [Prevotella sp.]|nr:DUF5012 domain-containing protein [Prevotella sp.]
MKKIFLYSLMLCLSAIGFTSCNDDNDELTDSRLTYYVNLELQGDEMMLVPIGSTFTDPGCKATLAGQDYTSNVIVKGANDVDPNKVGFYDISYSAINKDGFSASVNRTVVVYDPSVTASIAGTYSTDMGATLYGKNKLTFADRAAYYGNTSECVGIKFTEYVPGIFYCNDLFGGWYEQIRGYGNSYAMTGYVCLNPDNTITLLSSYVKGWGDGLDYIDNGVYDPETGQISYNLSYAGSILIDVVLNKD